MRKIITFIKSVLFPVVVGLLVGIIISDNMDYQYLIKPEIAPKPIVFPIVWIILYALMGISAYFIYTSKATVRQKNFALAVYAIQLVVNFLWSIVFFRLKMLGFSWRNIICIILQNMEIITHRKGGYFYV